MSEVNYLNKNEVVVVGTLVENGLVIREDKEGNTLIAGPISVKTVTDAGEQVFEFRLFSYQFKKNSTDTNGLFKTYSNLDNKVGKRIKVIGQIAENRFFQERTGQIVSFNYSQGRFIYDAGEATPDSATFEFAGYVDKPIHERLNKDGDLLYYEITLGQANYNGTAPIMVKFQVDADNRRGVSYIEKNYERGTTVHVYGDVKVEVEKVVKEEEVGFGTPVVKEYINTFKSYAIARGSEPIYGKNEYTTSAINDFAAIYEEETVKLQKEADGKTTISAKPDAKSTRATSLL